MLSVFHRTFNGDLGDNYPNPEGGILFTNKASSGKLPWGFYQGVVKDVASTNPNEALRFDIGTTSDLNSGSKPYWDGYSHTLYYIKI